MNQLTGPANCAATANMEKYMFVSCLICANFFTNQKEQKNYFFLGKRINFFE